MERRRDMAKHANSTLVGAFVVGAATLAVGGVIVFGGGDYFQEENRYVSYFEGSVSGLDIGAPIRFRGVELGNVTDIRAVWTADGADLHIPVELTFVEGRDEVPPMLRQTYPDTDAFVQHLVENRGLRAVLRQDSFVTGKLYVALELRPDEPVRRFGDGTIPEIPTSATELDKLKKSLAELPIKELFEQISETIAAVQTLVNDPEMKRLPANLNELVVGLDAQVDPLSESVQGAIGDARELMQNANAKLDQSHARVDRLLADIDAQVVPLSESAQGAIGDARALMQNTNDEVEHLSTSTQETMDEAQRLLANLNKSFGEEYLAHQVVALLEELEGAARAIRTLAEQLERHPEALISGKDK
jgi:paraquat-inducible protein B